MTPNFQGLVTALHVLKQGLETQASTLLADISDISARSGPAMQEAATHIAGAKAGIADPEAFNAAMRGGNGGPSSNASPKSSGASPVSAPATAAATAAALPSATLVASTVSHAQPTPTGAGENAEAGPRDAPATVLNVNGVAAS